LNRLSPTRSAPTSIGSGRHYRANPADIETDLFDNLRHLQIHGIDLFGYTRMVRANPSRA